VPSPPRAPPLTGVSTSPTHSPTTSSPSPPWTARPCC